MGGYLLMEYEGDKIIKTSEYDQEILIGYDEIVWNEDEIYSVDVYRQYDDDEAVKYRMTFYYTYMDDKISLINYSYNDDIYELQYTWVGNNVTKIVVTKDGEFYYDVDYEYDDKKNIFSAFDLYYHHLYEPEFMSENNVIQSGNRTFTYTYNDYNYPISYEEVYQEEGEEPESGVTSIE